MADLKVTYTDKVKLRDDGLDAINAWRDVDANELKEVINSLRARINVLETSGKPDNPLIDVSATWVSGFIWDVTADSFPVGDGNYYSATADQLTQEASHATEWRED